MDHNNLTDTEVTRIETVEQILAAATHDGRSLTGSEIARAARCTTAEAHDAAGYLVAQFYADRTANNAWGRYVATETVVHGYVEAQRRAANRAAYREALLA